MITVLNQPQQNLLRQFESEVRTWIRVSIDQQESCAKRVMCKDLFL